MDRLQRAAILSRLIESLRKGDSWTGETHIQKATYFLQEAAEVPLGYRFILYWHGPFSFELRDELTGMRADGLLRIEPQTPPYGPRYSTTELAANVSGHFCRTLERYSPQITFVSNTVGSSDVARLEQLATALFVTKKLGQVPVEERATELVRLKPHVSKDDAHKAISEVDEIAGGATDLLSKQQASC